MPLVSALVSLALAQAQAANTAWQAEVMAQEQAWSRAVIEHRPEIVRKILAEDYVGVDGRGVVSTRDDEIAEAAPSPDAPGPRLLDETLSDLRVRRYGEVAILTAINTATFDKAGVRWTIRYRRTTVYAHGPGGWRCVSFHASRIAG